MPWMNSFIDIHWPVLLTFFLGNEWKQQINEGCMWKQNFFPEKVLFIVHKQKIFSILYMVFPVYISYKQKLIYLL